MQYHSYVCTIKHTEPQNWFNPGVVGRGRFPLNLVKEPF